MGPTDVLNHLLNWLAPAVWIAVLVPLLSLVAIKKRPTAPLLGVQFGVNLAANLMVLGIGSWFFGHDGKMATYSGMALACATSQWIMLRGWRS